MASRAGATGLVLCPTLNARQAAFLRLPQRFACFCGGYGSGKSWAGCCALAMHFWEWPGIDALYLAPTYPQIRDIFYPTVAEAFAEWGLSVVVKAAAHDVLVYDGAGNARGTIRCRSMDRPETIVGFKAGVALMDELDTLAVDKAEAVWRKAIARMRYNVPGLQNRVYVATTPEGFRFTYRQFVQAVRERPELAARYGIVHASTWDNAGHLPADYIPSLMASYPEQLIKAYLEGEFVNLESGTVYGAYDRTANASAESIQSSEPVFVGMDFNVGKMAAVLFVLRQGAPHAVAEIVGAYDTPDMISRLQEMLWEHDGARWRRTRTIRVYPDASGQARKTVNASLSDLALLRDAGFSVAVGSINPAVRDRVNAVNAMLCNAEGARRLRINADACPTLAEALERQAYDKSGAPDKSSGYDHILDAAGYYIARDFPLTRRPASVSRTTSLRF